MLGTVSYSIYLMHNFWIYLVFRLVNHFTRFLACPFLCTGLSPRG